MSQPITIPAPSPGARVSVPVTGGKTFSFGFDSSDAVMSREAGDLVFEIGGGSIALAGFFTAPDKDMPDLLFPGGLTVAAADFRDALASDFETG